MGTSSHKFAKIFFGSILSASVLFGFSSCGSRKTTISIYRATFNIPNPDPVQVKKVEDKLNDYLDDSGASYHVELHDYNSHDYQDIVKDALDKNQINLLWTASWWDQIGTTQLVEQKKVADLTEVLKGTELKKSLPFWLWPESTFDGKILYIPVYKECAEGYELMFPTRLLKKYDFDISYIHNLSELEPYLEKCKRDGIEYPFLTQRTALYKRLGINDFDFITGDALIGVDRLTNKVTDIVRSDSYKEFCLTMCEWHKKGYINDKDVNKETNDQVPCTNDWGVSWWTSIPTPEEADSRYQQSIETTLFTRRYIHSTTTLGSCYAITTNSSQKQIAACIDFLGKLYTKKDFADIYTFGIEGEDFVRNENGFVKKTSEKYNHSMWDSTSVLCLSLEEGEPANKIQLYSNFNNLSDSSVAAGFRFDSTPVLAEYNACAEIYNTEGFVLENGGFDPDSINYTLEQYHQKLMDAGFAKVLEEASRQYDNWKKK